MQQNSETFSNGIASCLDTEAIDQLIEIITKLPGNPADGRKGGFFSAYDIGLNAMVTKSFGDYPVEKMGQYFRNSAEKVIRLVKRGDEYRSFQSRDEAKEQWGGGIYYGPLRCAFSGFPEKLDEALSLIYAMYVIHYLQWDSQQFEVRVSYEQAQRYADNEFIEPIAETFAQFYSVRKF